MRTLIMINPALTALGEKLRAVPALGAVWIDGPEKLRAEIGGAQGIVVSNSIYDKAVGEILTNEAPDLRWIQCTSVGTDALFANGVPAHATVTNIAGLRGKVVAEQAMALLLSLMRRLPGALDAQRKSVWCRDALNETVVSLEGKTMVLVGYGSIGREIARKAKAFDMHVIALNRSGAGGGDADRIMPSTRLSEVIGEADALVLAAPLSPDSRGLVDRAMFEAVKPGCFLVNVGRGELIDEAAMMDALKGGRLAGAGLDVFNEEPLPASSPLWSLDKVILTPHLGGQGGDANSQIAVLVVENHRRLQAGEDLLNVVEG